MGKQKKEKQKSASDKVVVYLMSEWKTRQWGLDDIGQYLFADFNEVSGTVREAYRRSTMNAFSVARAKIMDIKRELVIPKSYYKGTSGKVATWGFATNSSDDVVIIKSLVDGKDARLMKSSVRLEQLKGLVAEKGWLGKATPAISN